MSNTEAAQADAKDFQDEISTQLKELVRDQELFQKCSYKGETMAVKQFDLSKNFDSFESEVKAYKYLKEAWGEPVPTPKFISESPFWPSSVPWSPERGAHWR